jgi:hypothetical protein
MMRFLATSRRLAFPFSQRPKKVEEDVHALRYEKQQTPEQYAQQIYKYILDEPKHALDVDLSQINCIEIEDNSKIHHIP